MATKKVETKFYVVKRGIEPNEKCPPQSKLIVDTVAAAGGKIERGALLELLRRPPDQGGLKTGQTVERILAFYRPKLKASGIMEEETETAEVEVPDAPAAAPAAEGTAPAEGAAPAEQHTKHKGSKKTAA